MQKKLADYFQNITAARNLPSYYESWALLRQEDSISLTGALLGLNVLDCNLQLENDYLQHQPLSVDLSLYVKTPTIPTETLCEDTISQDSGLIDEQMKTVLDQKNYLEERNRQLMSKIENLNKTMTRSCSLSNGRAQFQVTDREMSEDMSRLEDEIHTLKARLSETEDAENTLRQQLSDTKALNVDLYEKLRIAEEATSKAQRELKKTKQHWQQEKEQLNQTIALLTSHNSHNSDETKKDEENQSLREQIANKFEEHIETMRMLSDKQHEVHDVSEKLEKFEELCKEQTEKLKKYPEMEEELTELRVNYADTYKELMECREALKELGFHLSESKLRIVELKEEFLPLSEAQWEKDSDVSNCKSCDVLFSYSRRKHHCRNCGAIFCQSCSNARVRLPSSSKAVRVCITCYNHLTNRQNSLTD
uniref:FYVE-type domain-containing protein n=1 Tax=Steinernema glaseri TaxID=37863 RepID=A0A1I7YUS7_9BILA